MRKFILSIVLLNLAFNTYSQQKIIKYEYKFSSLLVPEVVVRRYYEDFFVDSTILSNSIDYTYIYVDTFRIVKEKLEKKINGKWCEILSLDTRKRTYIYTNANGVVVENFVHKIYESNGSKVIKYVESAEWNGYEETQTVIYYDWNIGVIKILRNDQIYKTLKGLRVYFEDE